MKRVFVLVMFVIMLLIPSFAAYGDDCLMGRTPDGIYPMKSSDIIMQSEDIYIDVQRHTASCSFEFKNTGEAKDIIMGFPAEKKSVHHLDMADNLQMLNFKAEIDEADIPVKLENSISPEGIKFDGDEYYASWYTFTVHFERGETKRVNNSYQFVNTSYATGDEITGYIIDTGAYWKDKIGYAKVYFNMGSIKPYMIKGVSPNQNYRFDGTNIVWEYKDFEPKQNIKLMYNVFHYSSDFLNSQDSSTIQNVRREEENFNNIDRCIKTKDIQSLKGFYKQALEDNKPPLAEYIRENMGGSSVSDVGPEIKGLQIDEVNNQEKLRVIRVSAKDNLADFKSISFVISHMQNGKEITDNDYSDNIDSINTGYNLSYSMGFDFTPGIQYKIHCGLKDWNGNSSVRDITYTPGSKQAEIVNTEAPVNKNESTKEGTAVNKSSESISTQQQASVKPVSTTKNSTDWILLAGGISAAALSIIYAVARKRK